MWRLFEKKAIALGVVCLWVLSPANLTSAAEIGPDLERVMARRGSQADTAVILRLVDSLDVSSFAVSDRRQRDNRLVLALQGHATRYLETIEPILTALGAVRIKKLWMINAIAVTVPANAVMRLAEHPGIARIDADSFVQGGRSQRIPAKRVSQTDTNPRMAGDSVDLEGGLIPASTITMAFTPAWNIEAVRASEVWKLGHTGRGVVVAIMDTGVDLMHPDLRLKWRGGRNSWFDPHGEEFSPHDALGHGTQAAGVVVGGSAIGVAPDAKWIAVRLYDADGRASMSDIHLAFQWLLDPDGDPGTLDAPDVVNASWALTGPGVGSCILEFNDDIRALKSAGIAVVFAAGNDGPAPATSNSPGNNPAALSVGAMDSSVTIARQTSRGPSSCDGAAFPRLLAPGVNIHTTDLSHGGLPSYISASGSSLAAPHASGVLALLAGAFPSASVERLEAAILGGPVNDKDNKARYIDALAAFKVLKSEQESSLKDVPPFAPKR